MHGYKRRLMVAVAVGVGLTALTGSALAAPPSEPPGQEKKAEQAVTPAAPAQPAVAPGQAKKAEPAATKTKTHGVNATTAGTKPSNSTAKNTHTTVGAHPDVSKRYGNGKTAAQIAASNGAAGSEPMYGPGNSQPHKVCGKNGHWIDVHAVKSYTANRCGSTAGTSSSTATPAASVAPQTAVAASTPAASSSAAQAAGGVLGAEHTAGPAGASDAGGVAGAFAEIGGVAAGTLPFTGFPLWAAVLVALAAIAIGVSLWRRGRPAQTSDIV